MGLNYKNDPPYSSIPLRDFFTSSESDFKNKSSNPPPPKFEETTTEYELSKLRNDITEINKKLELLTTNASDMDPESLQHKRRIEVDKNWVNNALKLFFGVLISLSIFIWVIVCLLAKCFYSANVYGDTNHKVKEINISLHFSFVQSSLNLQIDYIMMNDKYKSKRSGGQIQTSIPLQDLTSTIQNFTSTSSSNSETAETDFSNSQFLQLSQGYSKIANDINELNKNVSSLKTKDGRIDPESLIITHKVGCLSACGVCILFTISILIITSLVLVILGILIDVIKIR
ncbi:hypothetical protein DFJ63DRAFT_336992 [Scheffersomyces coipomensis]|uniref:uncharacterized protein n=1 Tax=Scheffersomyces coipomensis TaxID=1788519 RepID=UPI00315D7CC1